jgi:hypothetical protein
MTEIHRHEIEEGTSLVDVVASLKALLAAGRGDEWVELKLTDAEGGKVDGPIHRIYPVLVTITRDQIEKRLAVTRETLAEIKGAQKAIRQRPDLAAADARAVLGQFGGPEPRINIDGLQASTQLRLDKLGAEAVAWQRQMLTAGEFAPELEKLDDLIAEIASLIQEPLDQRESGAGKVRVLDERRVARDANEVRDLPLADKLKRMASDHEAFRSVNEDAKHAIRQITGKPLIKAVEEILDEAFPDMMRAFYPRVYENVGRYHSPRAMAAMMANVVAEMLRYGYHRSATAYRLMMPGLAYMLEHRMPMFFLAPDLLEAVLRTDFDNDIDWTTLDLPYESGALMLPKGALVHPEDGEVAMILWSRVRKGDQPAPWPGIPISVLPNDSFVMLGACPETMIWYDSILTANVRPTMRLNNLFYRAPGEAAPQVQKSNFMDADLTEKDSEFVEKMGVILFGTILAMNARPQLVERGKLVKRVGKAEKAREFWSPNVIGARYKFKREVARISDGQFVTGQRATGTHASPRLHWRRGHYRNQPVGPGRKERKTIWLEPCLIGAEA